MNPDEMIQGVVWTKKWPEVRTLEEEGLLKEARIMCPVRQRWSQETGVMKIWLDHKQEGMTDSALRSEETEHDHCFWLKVAERISRGKSGIRSPPFWTLSATSTGDSQLSGWLPPSHPVTVSLELQAIRLVQTPANPLSNVCLITHNLCKTGPNTGNCIQK